MSDREYLEIETPIGKHKLKLKAWLTGGEKMALAKLERSDVEASTKASIETVVVGTPYAEIENYHGKDFDFVLEKMGEVITGSSLPKAQPSSDNIQT